MRIAWIVSFGGLLLMAVGIGAQAQAPAAPDAPLAVIPAPGSLVRGSGAGYAVPADAVVQVQAGSPDLQRVGRFLADLLGNAAEKPVEVRAVTAAPAGGIYLVSGANKAALGPEGYELAVDAAGVRILANTPAGAFYAVQTLRHLLPTYVEYLALRPRPVSIPAVGIVDRPRFAWRGAMLDVARNFFGPADLKRYIDLLALYKMNRLHLHLSDDQGWRLEITSWPRLATYGGSTKVRGGPGGFYTQAEFRDLIAYARDRFITIVPEFDIPSHTNAALASYAELNCNGVAPPLYTGIEVGFSNLCVEKDVTYRFLDDVVREVAALLPGGYFHLGGDEVKTLTPAQYALIVERMQDIVQKHGMRPVGWDEVARAKLLPSTIVQYWRPKEQIAIPPGTKIIMSPAHKAYIDMKYHERTPIGLNWAANIDVPDAYTWDPATIVPGIGEDALLGIEAPLWSETLATMRDVEYMAFPRLPGLAEIAWSPAAGRSWEEYRGRLAEQAQRWSALGINAYWSPLVPWKH